MYDFYFGNRNDIAKDEIKYLLSIKRMLPKWCNSIPDSEYIALYEIGDEHLKQYDNNTNPPVIVETGSGASTVVLAFLTMKYNGTLFTWDINGEKLSILRGIMVETICNYFSESINRYWKSTSYDSLSPHLGLSILKEYKTPIWMSFHDSKHTLNNLRSEVMLVSNHLMDNGIICIDDGNYSNLYEDFAYINIFRKKLGLPTLKNPKDNVTDKFYKEIENTLKDIWRDVEHIDDYYKHNYKNDIFFDYYATETEIRANANMEQVDDLAHRFDSWKVRNRK